MRVFRFCAFFAFEPALTCRRLRQERNLAEAAQHEKEEVSEYRKRKLGVMERLDTLPLGRAIYVPYDLPGGVRWYKGFIKAVEVFFPDDGIVDQVCAGDEWSWSLPSEEERGKSKGKKGPKK